jgi:hypothetical protein
LLNPHLDTAVKLIWVDQTIRKRIETGTSEGDSLGFTEKLFSGWLEIYNDSRLYLYYIISRRKNEGNTRQLINRWISEGYDVRIVMPSTIMKHIISSIGYEQSYEDLSGHYDDVVEVWRRSKLNSSDTSG